MYWFITQKKQRAILSIAVIILLHGCATEQLTPVQIQSQSSYNTNTTASSHLVQAGETLASIAKYYGVNYKTIAILNGLSSPYTIYPSQRLIISSYGTTPEYGGSQSIPVDLPSAPQSQPLKSYQPSRSRATTTTGYSNTRSGSVHTVQRGETLYGIARSYGKNFKQVAAWNQIYPPYALDVGQRLRMSGSGSSVSIPKPRVPSSSSLRKEAVSHIVRSGETLSDVAQRYGYSLQELARWNGIAPPYAIYANRRLRVAPYSSSPPSSSSVVGRNNSISHTVQPGETLSNIAQRYGYSVTELANWNGIASPYSLSVGRKLRVAPWTTSQKTQTRTTGTTTRRTTRSATSYTVAPGDTLYSVARRYGINVADIARWNNLQPPYTLSVGQSLRLASGGTRNTPAPAPPPQSQTTQTSPLHNTGYHTVARGDSLYSIATNYGYSITQIAAWNNLQVPYRLSVGQTLRVYPPSGARLGGYNNFSTRQKQKKQKKQKKQTNSTSRSSGGYHTVARGDTVYNIARRYGKTPANIMAWNNLQPPYNLSIGQRLRVSSSAAKFKTSSRQKSSTRNNKHIVKPGDTLLSIASRYGINANNLSEWNGIGPPYALYPGQQIWLVKPR